MYESYYENLQPCFGGKKIQLHYLDTDSFVLSVDTENFIKHLKNLEDLFVFSNLSQILELFRNKTKGVVGKIKLESPQKF